MSRTTIPTCRIGPNNRLISTLLWKTRELTGKIAVQAAGGASPGRPDRGMDHDRYFRRMKSQVRVRHLRRILCVFPRYAPSFGTFQHSYPLTDGVRAFMPPQGILVVASYLPESWEVRLVDENIRPATAEEFAWADAVFVSGMHVQKQRSSASPRAPAPPARRACWAARRCRPARRNIRSSTISISARSATRPTR